MKIHPWPYFPSGIDFDQNGSPGHFLTRLGSLAGNIVAVKLHVGTGRTFARKFTRVTRPVLPIPAGVGFADIGPKGFRGRRRQLFSGKTQAQAFLRLAAAA